MSLDLIVPADYPPMRLDRFVVRQVEGLSRRRLRDAAFRVNGRPAKHAALVRPGDVVSIPAALHETARLPPNLELALALLYEDEAVVAVEKPAGLSSVALQSGETDTVANFLVAAFPEMRAVGPALEGGLVHRLDRDTSGVVVAARSSAAHEALRRQFSAHRAEKEYLALVEGDVSDAGAVDVPIAHDPRDAARMCPCPERARADQLGARRARSRYAPVVRLRGATLLRVSMRSGVRHQVRLHLASIGHPILGDLLYGAPSQAIGRQALHACRVTLRHPLDGSRLSIESPLPADIELALRRLRGRR